MTARGTPNIIDIINRLIRASREMMREIRREPTPEELAQKLALPVEKVRKLLEIAKSPIKLSS